MRDDEIRRRWRKWSESWNRRCNRFLLLLGLAAAVIVRGQIAWAAPNPLAGKAISGKCDVCHGNNGILIASSIPNLAGQHYAYLLQQLKAFKNGTRKSPIMRTFALPLSKRDMQDLSAYFASIPIRVGHPKFAKPPERHLAGAFWAANSTHPNPG